MGLATAAAVVGGGALLQNMGMNSAASAAQGAANAQAAETAKQRAAILKAADSNALAALNLAEATPQELASLERAYGSADRALSREEKLINAIDPSIMEASKQALALLQGQTADINKPMLDLRNSQRQKLVNQLREQYGPGAETSAIGQRALQSFDMETNSLFAKNQSDALNQVFGIASQDLGGRLSRGVSTVQQVGQGYSALQDRKLNTQLNTGAAKLNALSGTASSMIQSAGAPYVGASLQAQGLSQLGNTAMNLGGMAAGSYLQGQVLKGMKTGATG